MNPPRPQKELLPYQSREEPIRRQLIRLPILAVVVASVAILASCTQPPLLWLRKYSLGAIFLCMLAPSALAIILGAVACFKAWSITCSSVERGLAAMSLLLGVLSTLVAFVSYLGVIT